MFLPSLCSAYLLLLTLLSSTLHSIFNTALLLFLLTDTSDPFHFLPDLPPTLHGQSDDHVPSFHLAQVGDGDGDGGGDGGQSDHVPS